VKTTELKRFIRNAVDLGIADLVSMIKTETKGSEREQLLHYLHNYADSASNPTGGIKKTMRRAREKELPVEKQ
jgi:hypothetical protein